uniref:Uncharacterized protein n=1 Tax=Trypanosoma congolense (strain IL3000) TaxID=1068625 RepID=G0UZ32_TRYCI|nr:hypothetical protein, unlikely [Trypanosoma congolense IL3000]
MKGQKRKREKDSLWSAVKQLSRDTCPLLQGQKRGCESMSGQREKGPNTAAASCRFTLHYCGATPCIFSMYRPQHNPPIISGVCCYPPLERVNTQERLEWPFLRLL